MIYEYREGLRHLRVELTSGSVTVVQRSTDASAILSFPLVELSATPAFYKQRDAVLKSATTLVGLLIFTAIIILSMRSGTFTMGAFFAALGVQIAAILAAYFLTPVRRYAVFHWQSGVPAFSLKSRVPESDFDPAVTKITQAVAQAKKTSNESA